MPKKDGLTAKQQAFVREYLCDFNATQAAIRSGYSKRTAYSIGQENLMKPVIIAAIAAGQAAASGRAVVQVDEILAEIDAESTSDIGDIMDFSGVEVRMRPACDIPANARRCIQSIKVKRHIQGHGDEAQEVEVVEFKLVDRLGAQRLALQRRGLLVDRVEADIAVKVVEDENWYGTRQNNRPAETALASAPSAALSGSA